jgi:hypothetical protein
MMDAETWATVRALLARGWVLAVAEPRDESVRLETPFSMHSVGVPTAVFYNHQRAVWSPGHTVDDAIRRAVVQVLGEGEA